MSRYWSRLVNSLTPYVPGEQPRHQRLVKLNTNENPYPPSPSVGAAVTAALEAGKPVVTANKALLADHGSELAALAEKNGVALAFEAAVAGGIPVGVSINFRAMPRRRRVRSSTPILERIFETWFLTVPSATPSELAISLLL